MSFTDAILQLSRDEAIYGCLFDGIRHDCGDKMGFLKATVDLALKREEFNGEFRRFLRERLGEHNEIPENRAGKAIVEPEHLEARG